MWPGFKQLSVIANLNKIKVTCDSMNGFLG